MIAYMARKKKAKAKEITFAKALQNDNEKRTVLQWVMVAMVGLIAILTFRRCITRWVGLLHVLICLYFLFPVAFSWVFYKLAAPFNIIYWLVEYGKSWHFLWKNRPILAKK